MKRKTKGNMQLRVSHSQLNQLSRNQVIICKVRNTIESNTKLCQLKKISVWRLPGTTFKVIFHGNEKESGPNDKKFAILRLFRQANHEMYDL